MSVEQADFGPGLFEPLPSGADLLRAQTWRVDDVDGVRVGSLRGLLVDEGSGEPVWGIVKLGRFGRCSAVPASYLAPGGDRVWASVERDPLRGAAQIDPRDGLNAREERVLLEHYGAVRSRRHLALQDRSDEETTSVPAPAA